MIDGAAPERLPWVLWRPSTLDPDEMPEEVEAFLKAVMGNLYDPAQMD